MEEWFNYGISEELPPFETLPENVHPKAALLLSQTGDYFDPQTAWFGPLSEDAGADTFALYRAWNHYNCPNGILYFLNTVLSAFEIGEEYD